MRKVSATTVPGTTLYTSPAPPRAYAVPSSSATMSTVKGSISTGQMAKLCELGVTSESHGSPLRDLSTQEACVLIQETIAKSRRNGK